MEQIVLNLRCVYTIGTSNRSDSLLDSEQLVALLVTAVMVIVLASIGVEWDEAAT